VVNKTVDAAPEHPEDLCELIELDEKRMPKGKEAGGFSLDVWH